MASSNTGLHSRRGTSNGSSSSNPGGETPVVILRVQDLSCQNLKSKDIFGYSDPFVVVSILGKQFYTVTPVCKRNLEKPTKPVARA
ncbi:hypothetical protein EDB85DRAFT_2155784 [Lactarius pseudohatsudake]|nr:hypothetical protein EDB85DRAFT_2155784 [Lactarius pseudohatsudake]